MIKIKFLAILCSFFVFSGCAIKPTPSDVTNLSTFDIVQRVRCEASEAIRSFVFNAIDRRFGDIPKYQELLTKLNSTDTATREAAWEKLNPDDLNENIATVLKRYETAAIAYRFRFDITQDNNQNATLNLARALPNSPFTVDLMGDAQHKRRNVRSLRIVDQFDRLGSGLGDVKCYERGAPKNYRYPIAGELGLRELIRTFLSLNQSGNLVGANSAGDPDFEAFPTISDQMTFTTRYKGTLGFGINITDPSESFRLVKAVVNAENIRNDIHELTVAISLPDNERGLTIGEKRERARRAASLELEVQRQIDLDNDTILFRRALSGVVTP